MAFNIDSSSSDKINDGVWASFGGSQFLIRHSSNFKFQKAFGRLQLPYRKKIDKGNLDPETSLEILSEALAIGILIDWKDVVDNSGEKIPYSREMAIKALSNNPDLREFVEEFSSEIDNFKEDEREDLGKD